jgi:hypothetical protein
VHLPRRNFNFQKISREQVHGGLPKLREPVLVTVDEVVGTGVAVVADEGGGEAATRWGVGMVRLEQQECVPGTGGLVAPEGLGAFTPNAALL